MLELFDIKQKLGKKEYKKEIGELRTRLSVLQQTIVQHEIPVIITFEGWSASGKGIYINKLLYPLDPRQFNVYTMGKVTEEVAMRPFLWAYWTRTPAKGRISIFDKSWHRWTMGSNACKHNIGKKENENYSEDVNNFEKQLIDDNNLIIKLFLHISKDEQLERLKALDKNEDTRWRIDKSDWEQNQQYDKYFKQFNKMIEDDNNKECKWNVIEADDKRYATVKMYKIIISKIEEYIRINSLDKGNMKDLADSIYVYPSENILSNIDVNKELSNDEYDEKLEFYQKKIEELGYKLYTKRKSVIIAYEGWDAAGKGGNIKRLTEKLDPRGYEVVPVPAPTKEELSHHYLWRFYNKLPKDGHIAIFDRSWYGRVLVERIEGFCSELEWKRAYKEINDMEKHITNHDTIIFKFWLHIDKEEQLNRFNARKEDPLKQYKITDEDWRNREKWDKYEEAVNQMLVNTDTEHAPWTIIESNNKKYARIKTLKIVAEKLEKLLK